MRVVGFNFTKINIEKFSDQVEQLKVNTNIDVTDVNNVKNDVLKTKDELVTVKFTFAIDYEPNFAKISFSGIIILSVDSKEVKEVLKMWEDKKLPEDFRLLLFNIILRKSNIKALELEEEMNLPTHIPLFSLKKEQEGK